MPNATQENFPTTPAKTEDSTVITPSCVQAVHFNPYERPIQLSEFEAKYGILCLDITSLVNDAGVNTEEALPCAHHKSVAAQRRYMMRNQNSEMAKFSELWDWSDVSHFGGLFHDQARLWVENIQG